MVPFLTCVCQWPWVFWASLWNDVFSVGFSDAGLWCDGIWGDATCIRCCWISTLGSGMCPSLLFLFALSSIVIYRFMWWHPPKLPLIIGDLYPHLIHVFLDPQESAPKWCFDRFSRSLHNTSIRHRQTHKHTHRPCAICSIRLHVCTACRQCCLKWHKSSL